MDDGALNRRVAILAAAALAVALPTTPTLQSQGGVTRESVARYERELREASPDEPASLTRSDDGSFEPEVVEVVLPDSRKLPVIVLAPPAYDPSRRTPLLLAMHGGPVGSPRDAFDGSVRMLSVWHEAAAQAGFVVVSPAMTHVIARGTRTDTRLPYEILTSEQMEAIIAAVARRYSIDFDRIVATGISLGSNFSIAFAASRPDRFAAIVPVSTEGDSRESLLRNLAGTSTYVLEGALDRNIRSIRGPRAMFEIQSRLGQDVVYREHVDRGHEGFQELYPEVLEWLGERRRVPYPREVWRVPHSGILPLARRVHWIETDTRAGLLRARVVEGNRIEIDARWTRRVRVYLNDWLVALDEPVFVSINGTEVFHGALTRSLELARSDQQASRDPARVFTATLDLNVPATPESLTVARRFSESVRPRTAALELSFWETYAVRSLEDRLPPLGVEGRLSTPPSGNGTVGVLVEAVEPASLLHEAGLRPGDLLLEVDGEPFYPERGLPELREWLLRELTEEPRERELRIRRGDAEIVLRARLALDPF